MSVITVNSGTARFTARTARKINAASLNAALPSASFKDPANFGNKATARTPNFANTRHSFTASPMLNRRTPGIEPIGSGEAWPSITNNGATKSAGRNTVSSTIARRLAVRRKRRGRWVKSSLK